MIAVDFSRQKELETDLIANQRIEVVGTESMMVMLTTLIMILLIMIILNLS